MCIFTSLPNSHIVSVHVPNARDKYTDRAHYYYHVGAILLWSITGPKSCATYGIARVCAYRSPDGWEPGKLSCKFYVCSVVLM